VSVAGSLYVTGGNRGNSGDQANAGWRYDDGANRWDAVAGLPPYIASGAAMLNGYAYFGDASGDVVQGARTVVEAVAYSKKVAEAMHAYIQSLSAEE
jgi:hypothetical protein